MELGKYGIWIYLYGIILLVILLIIWVIKRSGLGFESFKQESSIELLKKRYAKGEMSEKEFNKVKKYIT